MILIDTHTHLFLEEFDEDRKEVVENAIDNNIKYLLLPNIDSSYIKPMMDLCEVFPNNCFPMVGLHPTYVKENYREELAVVDEWLENGKFYGIGETGIDLYWDKTFFEEQKIAFSHQIELAKKYKLPIVIHSRDSFDEIYPILEDLNSDDLTGVFHCFTGNEEQAEKIIALGLKLGIGGVLTFKNSGLDKVMEQINLDHIVLEPIHPT
jgi:TatD DNase family protein